MLATCGLSLISQLRGSTAMSLICPLFGPNYFFCQIFTLNGKNTGAPANVERSQNLSSSLTKYSSIAGSRSRNLADCAFLNYVLATVRDTVFIHSVSNRIWRGSRLYLLWEIFLSCEISLYDSFFSEFCQAFSTVPGIVQDFFNAREEFLVAPWRGHQGDLAWIRTCWDRAGNFKPSATTLVLKSSAFHGCICTEAFFGWALLAAQLYGCVFAYNGIVKRFVYIGATEWHGIRQGKQADFGTTQLYLNLTKSPCQSLGSI